MKPNDLPAADLARRLADMDGAVDLDSLAVLRQLTLQLAQLAQDCELLAMAVPTAGVPAAPFSAVRVHLGAAWHSIERAQACL